MRLTVFLHQVCLFASLLHTCRSKDIEIPNRLTKDGKGGYLGPKANEQRWKDEHKKRQEEASRSTSKSNPSDGSVGSSASPRIINGDDAAFGRYPYTVSLQSVSSLSHFCGGSLIASDMVLSAAHCAQSASSLAVRINAHDLENPIDASEILPVEQVVLHPLYASITGIDHDFMILKLQQNATSTSFMNLNQNASMPAEEELLRVMGWGTTIQGTIALPEVLQVADAFYVSNEQCVEITLGGGLFGNYEGDVTDDMLCALEAGQGSCQGDSGGPIVIPGTSSDEDIQVGVVSWGIDCALPSYPGVYGRVSAGYDFIRSTVCRLSTNPPDYMQCDENVTYSPAPTSPPAFPSTSPAPSAVPVDILILIKMDLYPGEVGWTLERTRDGVRVAEVSSGTYGELLGTENATVSVSPGEEYRFTMLDSYGDGLCCSYDRGTAFVFLGNEIDYTQVLAYDNGVYSSSSSHIFMATASSIISFDQPSASPSATPMPSPSPTVTASPSSQQVDVFFVLTFDTYPIQTSWQIADSRNRVVAEGGPYSPFVGEYATETFALSQGEVYNFTIFDSEGDGICCDTGEGSAFLYLGTEAVSNQILVYEEGMFGYSSQHTFNASQESTFFVSPSPSMFPTSSPAPSVSAAPTGPEVPVTVVITMDDYANEIGWSITDLLTGETIVDVPYGTYSSPEDFQDVTQTVVVPRDMRYTFKIVDSWGDGLCCSYGQGFAYVYLGAEVDRNRVLAYEDGRFGSLATHVILASEDGIVTPEPTGLPSSVPTAMPSTSIAPTASPSDSPSSPPSFSASPSRSPTVSPTMWPTITAQPSSSVSEITVLIRLDRYPQEVGWKLYDAFGSTVSEVSTGTYGFAESEDIVTHTIEVETGARYSFRITDTASDGLCCGYGIGYFYIYWGTIPDNDRVLVYNDGRYSSSSTTYFTASEDSISSSNFPNASPSRSPSPFGYPVYSPPSGYYSPVPSVVLLPTSTPRPTVAVAFVTVYIQFDRYPWETSLYVYDPNNGQNVFSAPPGTYSSLHAETAVTETLELTPGAEYILHVQDTVGDGICCGYGNGHVSIYLGLETNDSLLIAHDDGAFAFSRNHTFRVSAGAVVDLPESNGPASTPPAPPTSPSPIPISYPTRSPGAEVVITIFFKLDAFPQHFGWALFDETSTEVASQAPGVHVVQNQFVSVSVPVVYDRSYWVFLIDTGGNGICCTFGDGYFGVSFGEVPGEEILAFTNGQFEDYEAIDFVASEAGILLNPPNITNAPSPVATPSLAPSNSLLPTDTNTSTSEVAREVSNSTNKTSTAFEEEPSANPGASAASTLSSVPALGLMMSFILCAMAL